MTAPQQKPRFTLAAGAAVDRGTGFVVVSLIGYFIGVAMQANAERIAFLTIGTAFIYLATAFMVAGLLAMTAGAVIKYLPSETPVQQPMPEAADKPSA